MLAVVDGHQCCVRVIYSVAVVVLASHVFFFNLSSAFFNSVFW